MLEAGRSDGGIKPVEQQVRQAAEEEGKKGECCGEKFGEKGRVEWGGVFVLRDEGVLEDDEVVVERDAAEGYGEDDQPK